MIAMTEVREWEAECVARHVADRVRCDPGVHLHLPCHAPAIVCGTCFFAFFTRTCRFVPFVPALIRCSIYLPLFVCSLWASLLMCWWAIIVMADHA